MLNFNINENRIKVSHILTKQVVTILCQKKCETCLFVIHITKFKRNIKNRCCVGLEITASFYSRILRNGNFHPNGN